MNMLSAQERLDYIIKRVDESGEVRVSALSEELNCSDVTIRNDIRKLDQQGYVRKVHGGAEARKEGLSISFDQGECFWHKEEKSRIAERAYDYINSRDSIIIDDSTTSYYLARLIRWKTDKHLIVVTNSILVAAELASAKHIELFVVSGLVMGTPPAALDNFTIEAFRQFNATKAFIGVSSLNLEKGVASLGAAQRDVKKAIIAAADELYVLADHTKFDRGSLFSICPMSQVKQVITDSQVRPEILEAAARQGISIEAV